WQNSENLWLHQIKYYPTDLTANKNIAEYYRLENDLENHFKYLSIAVQAWPDEVSVAFGMSLFYTENPGYEDYEQALYWADRSLALNPSYPGIYINRSFINGKLGNETEALNDLEKAQQLDPNNPSIYLNQAVLYKSIGRLDKAVASLDRYLSIRPNDGDRWIIQSELFVEMANYEKALEAVSQGLSINPGNGVYHYRQGLILDQMGLIEEAKRAISNSRTYGFVDQEGIGEAILDK
ncbi:MAG: tetratricopeptide repeat protein, partial [Bacteroidota bacterium]